MNLVQTAGGVYEHFTLFVLYSEEEISKQTWRRTKSVEVTQSAVPSIKSVRKVMRHRHQPRTDAPGAVTISRT